MRPVFPDASYVELLAADLIDSLLLPYYSSSISAGCPSPAKDYIELRINISAFVTDNPTSTFWVRVHDDSMQDAHIVDGSILAVDKSLKARSGDITVAVINNEFTVKRLQIKGKSMLLVQENTGQPYLTKMATLPMYLPKNFLKPIWQLLKNGLIRMRRNSRCLV